MEKNEIKKEVALAYEGKDSKRFEENALKYAYLIDSPVELNEFVEFLSNKPVYDLVEDAKIKQELRVLIKDKLFAFFIEKGDTPSNKYLYLNGFYSGGEGLQDERLDKYISFVNMNIKNAELGDVEKIYLAHLRFIMAFMRGDGDAIVELLKTVLVLSIHQVEASGEVGFIAEFLAKQEDFTIDSVFEALRVLFGKEYYFLLSYGERRSIFNWSLHCLWNIKKLFNDLRWVEMYPQWRAIFYEHLNRGEMDEAMYVHFYIYHKMGNSFQTQAEWRMFNEEISRVATGYYKAWAEKNKILQPKKEKRKEGKQLIGILKDRIVENSPLKVEYSVLKPLMENEDFRAKYDVKIYNMDYIEKSNSYPKEIAKFQALGIEYFSAQAPFATQGYYFSHLQKALYIRERIIDDGVDILIVPVSGYDISDFIFATRAAPEQIFWSHGNFEFDIEGIDKRITHIAAQSQRIESDYPFEHFDFQTDEVYLGLDEEQHKKDAEAVRARFPESTVILGAIGRLMKVDSPEYLQTVAKIMHECPDTVYLACGTGNEDSIKAQVEALGISDRFYFEGWIKPDIYGYVIDVYLDTFPETGGQSVVEYGEKNRGISIVAKGEYIHTNDSYIDVAKQNIDIYSEIGKSTYLKMFKNPMELDSDFVVETLLNMNLDTMSERLKILYEIAKYLQAEGDTDSKERVQEKIVLFRICEPEDYTEEEIEVLNVMLASPNILFYSFSPKGEVHSIIDAQSFIPLKIDAFSDTLKEYSFIMYIQGKNETYYKDISPLRLAKNILFYPIYYADHAGYESYKDIMLERFEQNCATNKESFLKGMDEFVGYFGKVYSGELLSFVNLDDCDDVAEKVYSSNTGTMGKKIVSLGYDSAVADAFIDSYSSMPPMSTLAKNISLLSHDVEGFREYYSCIKNYQQAQVAKTLEKLQSREEKDSVGLFIASIDS